MPDTQETTSTTRQGIPGLKPPDKFSMPSTAIPEAWKLFKQRWTSYAVLSSLSTLPNKVQVALFLHCLDDNALTTYNGFSFKTEENERTVAEIISTFDEFTIGEINITAERFSFNQRNQSEDESFEIFLSDLKRLSKTCSYCNSCVSSLIRDRIVLGIYNKSTQRELLKERHLNLEKCIDICRAAENADKHSKTIQKEVSPPQDGDEVNYVQKKKYVPPRPRQNRTCYYCGGNRCQGRNRCPAFGKTCSNCKKPNHFAAVCRAKQVQTITVDPEPDYESTAESDIDWVNTINEKKLIKASLLIKDRTIHFLVDSGASVNVLPKRYCTEIIPSSKPLLTYGGGRIHSIGTSIEQVYNPKTKTKVKVLFTVVDQDIAPIIGLHTAQELEMIEIKSDNFEQVSTLDIDKDKVFNSELGTFPGVQKLKIDPDVQPVIMPDRRVPVAIRPKLKKEIDRLQKLGVITPVTEPTPWVSQLITTTKRDGSPRVCIDPKYLNKALMRERYPIPLLDDVLHNLSESRVFTKVDLRDGYWHVQLDEESSKLTTFQTCFGRYRWLRLPQGLSVSSEIFQRKVLELFGHLDGVVAIHDDIIIHGPDKETHDKNLAKFLNICKEHNVSLKKEKIRLAQPSITFMGHIISDTGIATDPEKVKAITHFPTPKNVTEVRRFIGMIQFVARYIPHLTNLLHPLLNLTKKDVLFTWSESQEKAFGDIKQCIINSPQLAIYDQNKPLTIENDASDYGLGSTIMQEGRPLGFASRTLTPAEQNYAQIEKEALAITFGMSRFHHWTFGRETTVITDHQPLIPIFNKPLAKAPRRLQHMLLKLQTYDIKLVHKPGSKLVISDTLSRAPLQHGLDEIETDDIVSNIQHTPFNASRLQTLREHTANDPTLTQLKLTVLNGWPDDLSTVPDCIKPYTSYRDEITTQDGLLLRGERLIIPTSMRRDMLEKIHAGHIGINSCLRRARDLIFWPRMSQEIRQYVEACDTCATFPATQPKQPIISHEIPSRPWQKVGTDLFSIFERDYLLVVDYYSNFIEVDHLPDIRSKTVIHKMKAHFARHGIPEVVISDSGTQYTAQEFKTFAEKWNFKHNPSSPLNHASNGLAESAVKRVKAIMRKCHENNEDHYIGLLNLRNTPNENMETSPAQRLFNRRTNSFIPAHPTKLNPQNTTPERKLHIQQMRSSVKTQNRKQLRPLETGDRITFKASENSNRWKQGTISKRINQKSYEIYTGSKFFRRTRVHIKKIAPSTNHSTTDVDLHKRPQQLSLTTTASNSDNSRSTSSRVRRPPEKHILLPSSKTYE